MKTRIDFKYVFVFALFVGGSFVWLLSSKSTGKLNEVKEIISALNLNSMNKLPQIIVENNYKHTKKEPDFNCKMYSCFDVYKCGTTGVDHITIYLHPLTNFVDPKLEPLTPVISRQFYELYASIASSPFFVNDPKKACLFIPPIDLLNQNRLIGDIGVVLASLDYWNHGMNNLLFNMLPGKAPDYTTSLDASFNKAIVAGGGFSHWTYRAGFDVSIPVYSPVAYDAKFDEDILYPKWLLTAFQDDLHPDLLQELKQLAVMDHDFLLLQSCCNLQDSSIPIDVVRCQDKEQVPYPKILQNSKFCLILSTIRLGQAELSDALKAGCIPVIAVDTYVLPFSEVLDWKRASVVIQESSLPDVLTILKSIPLSQVNLMRQQCKFYYHKYFSSISNIVLTTIQIINDRVFPDTALTYENWNTPLGSITVHSPLFLPLQPVTKTGFTAVILAYDRIESLFQLITSIDKVPSLKMILIVWNNQLKSFPPKNEWPIINHKCKVIQTAANKLGNRFYPFNDIKTEAVLAIDDDIIMLTADEIEFGFQVWKEFPDRIVGFPPRLHLWTDDYQLKYESEWKNNVSIVLTGAAFYHNYFNHLYTYKMPGDIRDWVDEHMNCEDIAMNFIASNHTGKAPIKVTPRKKFKCPECVTSDSLSLAQSHMVERSTCINYFMSKFGMLPLKTVNFRADPVLFKDDFPEKLKLFPNIGLL